MIHFLEHKDLDFDKWDHCIETSLNGIIYPYSFYLNQVAPGWGALVMDDYKAVMPLPVSKKIGIRYIYQPFFVQQLGVFSAQPANEEMVREFVTKMSSLFIFADYNLNTHNKLSRISPGKITPRKNFELDLIPDYNNIFSAYSSNTKRNLKKAEKHKVFVTPNADPDIIINTFRQNKGRQINKLGQKQYKTLRHLIYSGVYRGNAIVYNAYDSHNNFCAGVVFLHSHKKTILIFSGSTPQARENGAMTAIIDQYIRDHVQQDITLDFEGSDDINLARFYAGFGAKECLYFQLTINNFPLILKPLAALYHIVRKKSARS